MFTRLPLCAKTVLITETNNIICEQIKMMRLEERGSPPAKSNKRRARVNMAPTAMAMRLSKEELSPKTEVQQMKYQPNASATIADGKHS